MNIQLSIIYIYYNTPSELGKSVESIKPALGSISHEIIVIDNNSPIPLPKEITSNKKITTIVNKDNKGYGGALNQGARLANGKYLLLVNPDTIFEKNSLKNLVDALKKDSNIGIIGPKFLYQDKTVQDTGTGLPLLPDALFAFSPLNKLFPNNPFSKRYFLADFNRDTDSPIEIPAICGACMMISKELFMQLDGFDSRFFLYFEEVDLCYRVKKAGYKVVYYPKSEVIHLGARSSSDKVSIKKHFEESRYKFFKKYHNWIYATLAEGFLRTVNRIVQTL